MTKFEENLELIRKVVRCEPVDRIPVVPCGNAYYARVSGMKMKDYITDYDKACDANLAEHLRMGADATQNVIFSPYLLGTQWLSKTAVPGVDSFRKLTPEEIQAEGHTADISEDNPISM